MKYQVQTMEDANPTGCLQGYVEGTWHYADLVAKLGEPTYSDGYDKTKAEWIIEFDDKDVTTASIYDYKQYGVPLSEITDWHIGGTSQTAVELVNRILNNE